MMQTIRAHGLRAVTVGECLGDPRENWYKPGGQFNGSWVDQAVISTDGTLRRQGGTPADLPGLILWSVLLQVGILVSVLGFSTVFCLHERRGHCADQG